MKHGTWVVVADGRKVLFLRNQGDNDYIDLRIFDHRAQENPPIREQGTDAPGRMYDAAGPGKSAMEATDWHQIAEDRFAREVASDIDKAAMAGKFRHLVLVAPPRALAEIRAHLRKETLRDHIVAEVNKDLTNHPLDKLEKILAKL
jgi:protein required for attachment to host cells